MSYVPSAPVVVLLRLHDGRVGRERLQQLLLRDAAGGDEHLRRYRAAVAATTALAVLALQALALARDPAAGDSCCLDPGALLQALDDLDEATALLVEEGADREAFELARLQRTCRRLAAAAATAAAAAAAATAAAAIAAAAVGRAGRLGSVQLLVLLACPVLLPAARTLVIATVVVVALVLAALDRRHRRPRRRVAQVKRL